MEYLNIYSNCQLVKGASRSLICDLQMRKSYPVSNDVYDVFCFLKDHSIEECVAHYGVDNQEAILSYVDFIVKKEMGFKDKGILAELSSLDLSWDAFTDITNVILEYNEDLNYNNPFFKALFNLNVHGLEVRCYDQTDLKKLEAFLATFKGSVLKYIKLILPYSLATNTTVLEQLVKDNLRIKSFLIHSAPEDQFIQIYKDSVPVTYYSEAINSCLSCGMIRSAYFITNMELFTESQQHNSCLNRKLSIDFNGFIKNCPSMQDSYGHMLETDLHGLLENPDFRKYWGIKKDDISVCRDCEYRHVCTDCRAYVEDPKDIYSKPLKCGYDPYTNEWEDWAMHPMKQAAIEEYGLSALIK